MPGVTDTPAADSGEDTPAPARILAIGTPASQVRLAGPRPAGPADFSTELEMVRDFRTTETGKGITVMSESPPDLERRRRLIWRHRRNSLRAFLHLGLSVLLVVFGIAGLALGHHQPGLASLTLGGVSLSACLLRSLRWRRHPF